MSSPSTALAEIKSFISSLRLDPSGVDFSSDVARRVYRRFHALLLWELVIDQDSQDPTVRLYCREMLSDLATSYFLNFIGAYKASRLTARGGIENTLRVLTAVRGVNILELNSVPALVSGCKDAWASNVLKVQLIGSMYSLYGELCNTVHSSAIDYMSLRVPFERIVEQDTAQYDDNARLLDSLFHLVGEALFLTFHDLLNLMEFKNADYIRDSVSAEIKRNCLEGV